jgi:hypothetical protein
MPTPGPIWCSPDRRRPATLHRPLKPRDTPFRLLKPWDTPFRLLKPWDTPFRLLKPWEMWEIPGHRRPTGQPAEPPVAEGLVGNQPIGPADAGSTRPA